MSFEDIDKRMQNAAVGIIEHPDGSFTNVTGKEAAEKGLNLTNITKYDLEGGTKGSPLYETSDGKYTDDINKAFSFKYENGKVKISASKEIQNSDWFKQAYTENDNFKALADAYAADPNGTTAYQQSDGTTKTLTDMLEDQKNAFNEYANGYQAVIDIRNKISEQTDGLRLSDQDIQTYANYLTGEDKNSDSKVQAIPTFALSYFGDLGTLQSFNSDYQTISAKDFFKWYNLDDGTPDKDTKLVQLRNALEDYVANYRAPQEGEEGGKESASEYAKAVSMLNTMNGNNPDQNFFTGSRLFAQSAINDLATGVSEAVLGIVNVIENIPGLGEGVKNVEAGIYSFGADISGEDKEISEKVMSDMIDLGIAASAIEELDVISSNNRNDLTFLSSAATAGSIVGKFGTLILEQILVTNPVGKAVGGVTSAMTKGGLGMFQKGFSVFASAATADQLASFVSSTAKLTGFSANMLAQGVTDTIMNNSRLLTKALSGQDGSEAMTAIMENTAFNILGEATELGATPVLNTLKDSKLGNAVQETMSSFNARKLNFQAKVAEKLEGTSIGKFVGVDSDKIKAYKTLAEASENISKTISDARAAGKTTKEIAKAKNAAIDTKIEMEQAIKMKWQYEDFNSLRELLGDTKIKAKFGTVNAKARTLNSIEAGEGIRIPKGAYTSSETANYIVAKQRVGALSVRKNLNDADIATLERSKQIVSNFEDTVSATRLNAVKDLETELKAYWKEMVDWKVSHGLLSEDTVAGWRATGEWGKNGDEYIASIAIREGENIDETVAAHLKSVQQNGYKSTGSNLDTILGTGKSLKTGTVEDYLDPINTILADQIATSQQYGAMMTRQALVSADWNAVEVNMSGKPVSSKEFKALVKNYGELSDSVMKSFSISDVNAYDFANTLRNREKALARVEKNPKKIDNLLGIGDEKAIKRSVYDFNNEQLEYLRSNYELPTYKAFEYSDDLAENVSWLESSIKDIDNKIENLSPKTDAIETVSNLSYKDRKALANKIADESNGEYVVLYRVQKGKPDMWRPNEHGKAGKFEGRVGEYKGFVWLTANDEWAEGAAKASAPLTGGKMKFSNEDIVAIPVRRADIQDTVYAGELYGKPSYRGGDTNKVEDLLTAQKEGKKLIQTRGAETQKAYDLSERTGRPYYALDRTDKSLYSDTEFILNAESNPEVFEDGMKLMLDKYNEQFAGNVRTVRKLETERAELSSEASAYKATLAEQSKEFDGFYNSLSESKKKIINQSVGGKNNVNVKNYNDALESTDMVDKLTRADVANSNNILNDKDFKDYLRNIKQQNLDARQQALLSKYHNDYVKATKDVADMQLNADEFSKIIYDMTNDIKSRYMNQIIDAKGSYKNKLIEQSLSEAEKRGIPSDVLNDYFVLSEMKKLSDSKEFAELINKNLSDVKTAAFVNNGQRVRFSKSIQDAMKENINSEWANAVQRCTSNGLSDAIDMDEVIEYTTKQMSEFVDKELSNPGIYRILGDDGKFHYMKVSPLIADLIESKAAYTPSTALMKMFRQTNQLFRYGTTGINITSFVNQFMRDPINAYVMGGMTKTFTKSKKDLSKYLGGKTMDELSDILGKYYDNAVKTLDASGKALTSKNIAKTAVEDMATVPTDLYSKISMQEKFYREAAVDGISSNSLIGKSGKEIKDISKKLDGNWMDNLMERTAIYKATNWRENTLRRTVYMNNLDKAIKSGRTLQEAENMARFVADNATTDFSRSFAWGQNIVRSVPYLGAAINGMASFWRLLEIDTLGIAGRFMGGIAFPQMALVAQSCQGENLEVYKNIPEWQKEENLVFVANGTPFKLPIPQELAAFLAPFRQMVEKANGANDTSWMELLANDALAVPALDLTGFMGIDDNDLIQEDNEFIGHLQSGFMRLASQVSPEIVKTYLMAKTGVDPFTGQKIDQEYGFYDDEGNWVIVDSKGNAFTDWLAKQFGNQFSSSSAYAILKSMFGNGIMNQANAVAEIMAANQDGDYNKHFNNILDTEAYSLTKPFSVSKYDQLTSDFRDAVKVLEAEKMRIQMPNGEVAKINSELGKSTDANKINKLQAQKRQILQDYADKVKNMVETFVEKGGKYNHSRESQVLSLLTFDSNVSLNIQPDAVSNNYKQMYYDAAETAKGILSEKGFKSTNDNSIFGYLSTDKYGNVKIKTTTPTFIANFSNEMYGSNSITLANIEAAMTDAGLDKSSDSYKEMKAIVDKAYKAKDYDTVNKVYKDWDMKVMNVISPIIAQNDLTDVLNNSQVIDYLDDYIMVPSTSEAMGKGKYYSSKTGLNKQRGYAKSYIQKLYDKLNK